MKRFRSRQRRSDWQFYRLGGLSVIVVFVFITSGTATTALAASTGSTFQCQVRYITDGDTLRCMDGTRIRLHGISARESDETCRPNNPCPSASGASATTKLTELAAGQTLQCEATGTSYNRVTAICRNQQNIEINCAMVQSGTTLLWPKFDEQRHICR